MADDLDNHTLRVLQELRAEMRDRFSSMEEQFAGIGKQIDGSTLILKVMAGLIHEHEQRIAQIEAR